jgi:hypothetical protein
LVVIVIISSDECKEERYPLKRDEDK